MYQKYLMKLIGKRQVITKANKKSFSETVCYFTYNNKFVIGKTASKLFIDEAKYPFNELKIGCEYYVTINKHMQLIEIKPNNLFDAKFQRNNKLDISVT